MDENAVLCGEPSLNGRHHCGLERGHPAVRGHIAFESNMTIAWGFGSTQTAPRPDSPASMRPLGAQE